MTTFVSSLNEISTVEFLVSTVSIDSISESLLPSNKFLSRLIETTGPSIVLILPISARLICGMNSNVIRSTSNLKLDGTINSATLGC